MSSNPFQLVFSLRVYHSFFDDGICKCLSFAPSHASQQLMSQQGFAVRSCINGFDLYSNAGTRLNSLLSYLSQSNGVSSFAFDIVNRDASFNLFTDLPVDWCGQLAYNSSKSNGTVQERAVLPATYASQSSGGSFGQLQVNFSSLAYTGGGFCISFHARATQWQYFVVNNSSMTINNPAITGDSPVQFTGPVTASLQNGQEALLFTSGDATLALSETPRYKFDLVSTQAAGENGARGRYKTLVKNLPAASPSGIERTQAGNIIVVSSPIYIYI